MSELTISEIRKRRGAAETEIRRILSEFVTETGVSVTRVNVEALDVRTMTDYWPGNVPTGPVIYVTVDIEIAIGR